MKVMHFLTSSVKDGHLDGFLVSDVGTLAHLTLAYGKRGG